jgi:hypothetical protein
VVRRPGCGGEAGAAPARRAHACGPDLGRAGRSGPCGRRLSARVSSGLRQCDRGLLHDGAAGCRSPVRDVRLAPVVARRPVSLLWWWWITALRLRRQGATATLRYLGRVLLTGWVSGVRQFGRKSCPACVGAGDDGAFGHRFPPWRHRCEAPASPPPSGCCLQVKTLIRHAELAMVASLMSLLC